LGSYFLLFWFPGTNGTNILAEKLAFLNQNKAKLCKNLILTLVFEKNAIFCRKLSKIAENCDHNIDPSFTLCRQGIVSP
jgi:hypothetical protein